MKTIIDTSASTRLKNALRAYVSPNYFASYNGEQIPHFKNLELTTLSEYTELQFLRIRNLGQNSVNELKEILAQNGLSLK